MERKNKGFPFEYYPGEILTEKEAVFRFKMCLFRLMNIGGFVTSNVLLEQALKQVIVPLPIPINKIQESMVSESQLVYLIIPEKNILTDLQLNEFNQIGSKFLNGSITIDEAILELRGGGRFEEICYLVLFIWLSNLQNNSVEGFQSIRPPHQQLMPNQRPPYIGGYGSSNSGPSLGLKNNKFNEFSQNKIQNAYKQIPNLPVKGTNFEVTAWSAAKHVYHAPAFGLDPTEFGMT